MILPSRAVFPTADGRHWTSGKTFIGIPKEAVRWRATNVPPRRSPFRCSAEKVAAADDRPGNRGAHGASCRASGSGQRESFHGRVDWTSYVLCPVNGG